MDLSEHLLMANYVIYYLPSEGVLSYVYRFSIFDEYGNKLVVFVPDEYVDDFLRDYPDAF